MFGECSSCKEKEELNWFMGELVCRKCYEIKRDYYES